MHQFVDEEEKTNACFLSIEINTEKIPSFYDSCLSIEETKVITIRFKFFYMSHEISTTSSVLRYGYHIRC